MALLACSAGAGGTGGSGTGATGAGGSASTSQGGAGGKSATQGGGGSTGSFMNLGGNQSGDCNATVDEDHDQDGFTITQGDCNDCDANVNPGAIEVIANTMGSGGAGGGGGGTGGYVPADEDCDGTADNPPEPCDQGLPLAATDAMDGARAIELCKEATGPKDYGVISAEWVHADGTPDAASVQVGIEPVFGPNVHPKGGSSMLLLSSGTARLPGQPDACTGHFCNNGTFTPSIAPPGFPQAVPNCVIDSEIYDDVALEVHLRAPTNATGYRFAFKFHSFEYAEYVCTNYNDQFIALVNPPPMGSQNGNISFDQNGNPVSVNIAFFDVCSGCADFAQNCFSGTCPVAPNPCCPSGPAELMGTGFDTGFTDTGFGEDAGGTSWLQTTAPITGGEELTIRFAIWDTGDSSYDSTSLIDNFEWIANGGTVSVGTTPIPQ